jgi:hypothetical protein
MQPTFIIVLVVLLLVRRIQRSIGFQKYNKAVMIVRIVLFGLIAFSFLFAALLFPIVLAWDSIGIIAGLALAYVATNHAQFEKREKGLYFKTHVWVEITVITLFVARYAYRIFVLKDMYQENQSPEEKLEYLKDPLSGIILYTFCTYYLGYFSFILKEAKMQ